MSTTERELEHELDGATDVTDDLPANLDERQEALLEVQQVYELTHAPDVMKLPVKHNGVTTAENSDKWSITLEHPISGDVTIFVEKPVTGWTEEHELAQLLSWYNIHDQDVYKLQQEFVYVEHDPSESDYAHGWTLTHPPWVTLPGEVTTHRGRLKDAMTDIPPSFGAMWTTLMLGVGIGALVVWLTGLATLFGAMLMVAFYVWASVFALGAFELGESV